MIIKYRVVSGKNENFVRDIELYSDATFMDLHLAIQEACRYDASQLTTFYLSNRKWDKLDEIAQDRMDAEIQENVLLMAETPLDQFTPKVGQRYIYIFDFFSVRSFFLEIVNMRQPTADDQRLHFPICTFAKGCPPQQIYIDDIDEGKYKDDYYRDDYDEDAYFADERYENIDDLDI